MDFTKLFRTLWRHAPREGRVSQAAVQRATPLESRVGPRAAAWVDGHWEHAQFEARAAQGFPALTLQYGLYLPPGAADSSGLPLVVMLHGCNQSGEAFARGTRMNVLADRYGFAVLYPDQTIQRHAHACWHWYDLAPAAGGGEAHAIAALVASLVEQHAFDATRVYLAGLSAGAGMAAALAFQYPQQFAAVALHSGVVCGATRSVVQALDIMRRGAAGDPAALARAARADDHPGMPALLLHGALDDVVSPINLTQLETQFLTLNQLIDETGELVTGASLAASEHEGQVDREYRQAGQCRLKSCLIPGLGHAWSGGDDTVPYHAGIGPDASLAAWTFFEAQRRLPAPGATSRQKVYAD